jgi:hypothetical protein
MSVAFWSIALNLGKPIEVQPPEGNLLQSPTELLNSFFKLLS